MQLPSLRRLVVSTLIASVAIGSLAAFAAPIADAQSLIDRRQQRQRSQGEAGMSRDEAVSIAESRYRAKAVKVDTVRSGDRVVYHIRLLNAEGKVWTVQVDGGTGR
jgi:uncharacterized membrane protein YkoI